MVNKSPGSDQITNEMIKDALQNFKIVLLKLFNLILNSEYFDELWSFGLLKPIHKENLKENSDNYRGITLNSCVAKLFCSIIHTRLAEECEENIYYQSSRQVSEKVIEQQTKYFSYEQSFGNT